MRDLSDPQPSTYESVAEKLKELGFEQLQLNIPVRKDVVKFAGMSVHRKGDVTVQLSSGKGKEAGLSVSHLSISAMDKNASLEETVRRVSDWLGSEPEYPTKSAQFAVIESEAGWMPIALSETRQWPNTLKGSLAHISVSDMGFGISITRIVTRTS